VNWTAVICALVSAALFGISTPAAKALVGSVHPATLAGLLYCGAGIGIAGIRRALPWIVSRAPEVSLARSELPWLAGAIGSGGVVGPLLLMVGLTRTDAATASLLLTLEAAVTALMAWFIFQENCDRRVALGMASFSPVRVSCPGLVLRPWRTCWVHLPLSVPALHGLLTTT
jgi:drug/metabolite transporter (DMT)-like permease